MTEENINSLAFELAYGKGKVKKWALEDLVIDTLYKTNEENIIYIKTSDINCFGKADEENDKELIYKYGYLNRIPRTEIDLIVNKSNGMLMLKKVDIGWGYENVERELYNNILKQIKNKNIYFSTNFNGEEYLIK